MFVRPAVLPLLRALLCGTAVASLLCGCAASDEDADATVTITGLEPSPDPSATRDREVAEVYAAAKAKDVSRLLGYTVEMPAPSSSPSPEASVSPGASARPQPSASAVATSSPTPVPRFDPAIALALYVVDPKTYTDSFVASYPADSDGVMVDYGSRLLSAHVVSTGPLFPIAALETIAATGNARALRRLYDALPSSRGGIQAAYAREIATAAARDPSHAIAALAEANPAARLDVLANAAWCGGNGKTMLTAATTTDFQATLKSDLGDTVRTQCVPPASQHTAKRGQPARHDAR